MQDLSPSPLRKTMLAALLFGGALLFVACEPLEAACPPGVGRGLWEAFPFGVDESVGGPEGRLLENPNFGATPEAAGDLRAGVADRRLVAALAAVAEEHRICVDAIKEGHYFVPGVPDGPLIPEGYGEAGGLPNTHYYGRAADIRWVEGEPVQGNGADEAVLGVGRMLQDIPPGRRPDQIIGPESWAGALGYPREDGWILAPDQLELHEDHIHIGYMEDEGTRNAR